MHRKLMSQELCAHSVIREGEKYTSLRGFRKFTCLLQLPCYWVQFRGCPAESSPCCTHCSSSTCRSRVMMMRTKSRCSMRNIPEVYFIHTKFCHTHFMCNTFIKVVCYKYKCKIIKYFKKLLTYWGMRKVKPSLFATVALATWLISRSQAP